jgi:16S rRNA (cytosine1402-N4)-methyltransferase
MDNFHKPVLLAEALHYLDLSSGSKIVDCTIGGAGHAVEVMKILGNKGTLLGLDLDDEALNVAKEVLAPFSQQIILIKGNFKDLDSILKEHEIGLVDGIFFDLGISSHQIDKAERGFSFQKDGPLDMRMDNRQALKASDVINQYKREEIEKILKDFGEERYAKKISRKIVERRDKKRLRTTKELEEVIRGIISGSKKEKINPATRTFQAIRIEVNKELKNLKEGLNEAIECIRKGGRIVVISYHSIEDRIVKETFKRAEKGCVCPPDFPKCVCNKVSLVKVITKKPVRPSVDEVKENPRARSAKLRAVEKIV